LTIVNIVAIRGRNSRTIFMGSELFSERIRRWRLRHGLSQEEAGVRLGVSGRYIGMLERGDKEVELSSSLAKLFAIYENAGEVPEQHSARVQEPTARDHEPVVVRSEPVTVAARDAEIVGLTALLNEHTALVNAGVRKGDLPIVRRALELALESRGILPRKSE
jgi:transcriptional regulator with XRE-family HTH domain